MSRLTELLERIRPAGSPGAAAAGGAPSDTRAVDELADLTRALAALEAEADEVVDRARERADRLLLDAGRDEQRIRSELPERIAVARTETAASHEDRAGEEVAHLLEDARREADRRHRAADARIEGVVETALERIWALAEVRSDGEP